MESLSKEKKLTAYDKCIPSIIIKDQAKKVKCHYCYSCDVDREYATCIDFPRCSYALCHKCLEKFFKLRAENLSRGWCFGCRKVCNCESCREEGERNGDTVVVLDWRNSAYLKTEKKFTGPKVYRVKTNKSKLNCDPVKRSQQKHRKKNSRREYSGSFSSSGGEPLKKRKVDLHANSPQAAAQSSYAFIQDYSRGADKVRAYCPTIVINPAQQPQFLVMNPGYNPFVYAGQQLFVVPEPNCELRLTQQMGEKRELDMQINPQKLKGKVSKGIGKLKKTNKSKDMKV
eukprot:TRINITY_DN3348_c0_g2_i1.p1 TRINITY_DN3348_c0_g2~~TRINITY_DN3348_c0_g2_i1.p1  ORF type:complete len:286 (+),score=45.48 TRINITY_DN3348_c0_g2_i1:1255-2112(+)